MNFIDLAAQQRHIRKQLEQNISGVLDHGKYINGPEVQTLEKKLAQYTGGICPSWLQQGRFPGK